MANYIFDENKNVITAEEVEKFGMLDTGTGTLDKVEINPETMELVNADCGDMYALCMYKGVMYKVEGKKLVVKE